MSKHTPGPWVARQAIMRGMVAEISAQLGEARWTVAHVDSIDGGDKDAANAHLIAAAPELLAALRMARTWVAGFDHEDRARADLSVIDAAIAKATS